MKKLLLVFLLLAIPAICITEDRVTVQVQFRKALWTCPKCGHEDVEDLNISGGNTYEHNCSKCGAHFNQSGPNMREYNGSIRYLPEEYEKAGSKKIEDAKKAMFNEWKNEIKRPARAAEPTEKELTGELNFIEQQKASLESQKQAIQQKIEDKKKSTR